MLITEKKNDSQAGDFWEGCFQRQTCILLASVDSPPFCPFSPGSRSISPAPHMLTSFPRTVPHLSTPKEGASDAAFPEVFLSICCCRRHLQKVSLRGTQSTE